MASPLKVRPNKDNKSVHKKVPPKSEKWNAME